MLSIEKISLALPFVVAPMAGVSDLPFRLVSRELGAPLAFTEMIDARALGHRDRRTSHMLSSGEGDRPLGVQIVGNEEEYLLRAIDALEKHDFDLLDLNAACPAPKVTRKGMGASLLRDPERLGVLLSVLVRRSSIPVTVKIRAGWDATSVNGREVALRAEDAGVNAIFIHGRTKVQGYSGTVDYGVIREVKGAVKVPVIASGDNMTVETITRMFRETGCDGVAIARGSLGNPWIFRDMGQFLRSGVIPPRPDAAEIALVMKRHLELVVSHYGEKRGTSSFRKFCVWYTRGLSDTRPLRDRAFRAATKDEILEIIDEMGRLQRGREQQASPESGESSFS